MVLLQESATIYEDNYILREELKTKLAPKIRDFRVEVDGGFFARARLLLPPDLDEDGDVKYPMVVNV